MKIAWFYIRSSCSWLCLWSFLLLIDGSKQLFDWADSANEESWSPRKTLKTTELFLKIQSKWHDEDNRQNERGRETHTHSRTHTHTEITPMTYRREQNLMPNMTQQLNTHDATQWKGKKTPITAKQKQTKPNYCLWHYQTKILTYDSHAGKDKGRPWSTGPLPRSGTLWWRYRGRTCNPNGSSSPQDRKSKVCWGEEDLHTSDGVKSFLSKLEYTLLHRPPSSYTSFNFSFIKELKTFRFRKLLCL